jgi:hypothetical protein
MAKHKKKGGKKGKFWHYAGWTAFGLVAAASAREIYLTFGPNREERRTLYQAAAAKAKELGKPLVVLGDPDAGLIHHFLGRDYQCGTICVDPQGCGACTTQQIAGNVTMALQSMGANSAVIFDGGGVFPFADDGYELANQIKRVAGQNVYMFDVGRWTLTSWFEPKRKRTLSDAPPETQFIAWTNGLLTKEPSTGQRNGSVSLSGLRQVHIVRGVHGGRVLEMSGFRGLGYGAGPQSMHYYERIVQRYPVPQGQYVTL